MNDAGGLVEAKFTQIICFCHILTHTDFSALEELKDGGYIFFRKNRSRYTDFSITEKGIAENAIYLNGAD